MKQKPDALLYCRSFIDVNLENGLLYLKNDTIYYYYNKPIAISDVINNLPSSKKKCLNSVQVPFLHQVRHQSELYRNTCDTIPKNENMFNIH